MSITRPDYPVDNVQQMANLVKDQATTVKQNIDKGIADTKDYIKNVLCPELDSKFSEYIGYSELNTQLNDIAINIETYPKLALETSDLPRIQRAIDALPDGSTLRFGNKVYDIENSIVIRNKKDLIIEGNSGTVMKIRAGILEKVFSVELSDNITFKGLIIDGSTSTILPDENFHAHGISFNTGSKNGTVMNCTFMNLADTAVYDRTDALTSDEFGLFSNIKESKFIMIGCRVINCRSGFNTKGTSKSIILANNHFECVFQAMKIDGEIMSGQNYPTLSGSAVINGNVIRNTYVSLPASMGAIELEENIENVIVSNNVFDTIGDTGIRISAGQTAKPNYNLKITNNIFSRCQNYGMAIRCQDSGEPVEEIIYENLEISSNKFDRCFKSIYFVSMDKANLKNCLVSGNTVTNFYDSFGINFTGVKKIDGLIITQNMVTCASDNATAQNSLRIASTVELIGEIDISGNYFNDKIVLINNNNELANLYVNIARNRFTASGLNLYGIRGIVDKNRFYDCSLFMYDANQQSGKLNSDVDVRHNLCRYTNSSSYFCRVGHFSICRAKDNSCLNVTDQFFNAESGQTQHIATEGLCTIYYGTATPTTGTYKKGDRVLNSNPTVGQPKSWVCTAAGSPGVWTSEGNL